MSAELKARKRAFASSFAQVMAATSVLFFISVGAGPPVVRMVIYVNDARITKPPLEWTVFILGGLMVSAAWSGLWIWFKYQERKCLEILGKR